MSVSGKQLVALLRTMVRMDFRSRTPLGGGRRSRTSHGLLVALVFYFIVGAALGFSSDVPGFDPVLRMTLLLGIVAIYLTFSILLEYQQILLSPSDADVLFWRPIDSKTLFVARSLHVFLYVNLLSAALLLVPSFLLAGDAPGNGVLTWVAFVVAGTMNAAFVTGVAILLYSFLLRHVAAARLQDVLAWFQVVMSLMVFLGYQALGPILARALTRPGSLEWLRVLPARWFVAPAEMVGWGVNRASMLALFLGVFGTAIVLRWALQHLAPQFQSALAEQATQSGVTNQAPGRTRRFTGGRLSSLGRFLVRGSTERAGYDFFVSMFRGDARLKTTLLPLMALPVAFVLFGLAQGAFPDPYASDLNTVLSERGPAAEQALRLAFFAVYFLVFSALTLGRALSKSPSWKAAWVYYVSPLTRYDRFHRGVLCGALSLLLFPTVLVLVILLEILWRNPLHVLLHLSIPVGLLLLSLPLSMWRADPPFSCEPVRHERMGEFFSSMLFLFPLFFVAFLHYQLREMPWILLLVGLALAMIAFFLWWLTRDRVQRVLHARSFDA